MAQNQTTPEKSEHLDSTAGISSANSDNGTADNSDLSRLDELFYPSRTTEAKAKEASLKGFLRYALQAYLDNLNPIEKRRFKVYTFCSTTGNEKLELSLLSGSYPPPINRISIYGSCQHYMDVLNNLEGITEMEFADTRLSYLGLGAHAPAELEYSPETRASYLQLGNIGIDLTVTPDDVRMGKTALQRKVRKHIIGRKQSKPVLLSEAMKTGFSEVESLVLSKADIITVRNNVYEDNDPKNELTEEETYIWKKEDDQYAWVTHVRSLNVFGFPASECLPRMESLFNLIKGKFDLKSFYRMITAIDNTNLSFSTQETDNTGGI